MELPGATVCAWNQETICHSISIGVTSAKRILSRCARWQNAMSSFVTTARRKRPGFLHLKDQFGAQPAMVVTHNCDPPCNSCRQRDAHPHAGERYVRKRIKSDAARYSREFDLSLDYIVGNCHKPCHYCGRVDQNMITVKSRHGYDPIVLKFRYNGFDRVDNSLGYTEDNCVTCCFVCNRAKGTMSTDEFKMWIRDIIEVQGK